MAINFANPCSFLTQMSLIYDPSFENEACGHQNHKRQQFKKLEGPIYFLLFGFRVLIFNELET